MTPNTAQFTWRDVWSIYTCPLNFEVIFLITDFHSFRYFCANEYFMYYLCFFYLLAFQKGLYSPGIFLPMLPALSCKHLVWELF